MNTFCNDSRLQVHGATITGFLVSGELDNQYIVYNIISDFGYVYNSLNRTYSLHAHDVDLQGSDGGVVLPKGEEHIL
jgi:hypothetical protein